MSKMLYCPVCGKIRTRNSKSCPKCNSTVEPAESLFDGTYYKEKAEKLYGLTTFAFKVLILEEASKSTLYDKHKSILDVEKEKSYLANKDNIVPFGQALSHEQPRCPTCNSVNVQRIPTLSKVIGASMFGLFSKTATSQFKCNSCGYKW